MLFFVTGLFCPLLGAYADGEGLYAHSASVVEFRGDSIEHDAPTSHGCPVLLQYYSHWCGHCRSYAPTYARLAKAVDDAEEVFAYIIAVVDCSSYHCERISQVPEVIDIQRVGEKLDVTLDDDTAFDFKKLWKYVSVANARFVKDAGQKKASECAKARFHLQKRSSDSSVVQFKPIPQPNRVWASDLRRALYRAIGLEPVRRDVFLNTSAFLALRKFVTLAADAFPETSTRDRLAGEILPLLDEVPQGSSPADISKAWLNRLDWLVTPVKDGDDEYFGCQGSTPRTRGFTCALWQLFHALLANAKSTETDAAPHAGLSAIHAWIAVFFSCEECRRHFLQMADEMGWRSVATDDSAVLWLWRAHNQVNARLVDDVTEDPMWPKVQFPRASQCRACWNDNGFDEGAVLVFLRSFYQDLILDEPWGIWIWMLLALALVVCYGLVLLHTPNTYRRTSRLRSMRGSPGAIELTTT